ncbi:MAG: hypothetical protein LBF16_09635 [Pseudomonadales bacterium]|jgi:hypothetical protein|nr:hypothetical protein [Pseudomonadales bacterium]
MFHRLFTLGLCLALLSPAGLFAADNPYAPLIGTYTGEVFNGDDLDAVVTVFSFTSTGILTGSYTVDEETGVYSGTLSNFLFEDAHTISMEWTDKFGEGLALMEFSSDFRSFTGGWTQRDGLNPLPWNGEKVAAE